MLKEFLALVVTSGGASLLLNRVLQTPEIQSFEDTGFYHQKQTGEVTYSHSLSQGGHTTAAIPVPFSLRANVYKHSKRAANTHKFDLSASLTGINKSQATRAAPLLQTQLCRRTSRKTTRKWFEMLVYGKNSLWGCSPASLAA